MDLKTEPRVLAAILHLQALVSLNARSDTIVTTKMCVSHVMRLDLRAYQLDLMDVLRE